LAEAEKQVVRMIQEETTEVLVDMDMVVLVGWPRRRSR
jgi:hypothetical protein